MVTDEEIELKAYSEVDWSYFGGELTLISIIDLNWKRLNPLIDIVEYGLGCVDDTPHILIRSECLVIYQRDLLISRQVLLYTEEHLLEAGNGPLAIPDNFTFLDDTPIDLSEDIPKDIAKVLIDLAKQPSSYLVEQMLHYCEDEEEDFIATIKNSALRNAFIKQWKKLQSYGR
jgi:hypothetical protein